MVKTILAVFCHRYKGPCCRFSCHGKKHSKTLFTIEILIERLATRSCMTDLFCKSMAASNFCHDRKSTPEPDFHSMYFARRRRNFGPRKIFRNRLQPLRTLQLIPVWVNDLQIRQKPKWMSGNSALKPDFHFMYFTRCWRNFRTPKILKHCLLPLKFS